MIKNKSLIVFILFGLCLTILLSALFFYREGEKKGIGSDGDKTKYSTSSFQPGDHPNREVTNQYPLSSSEVGDTPSQEELPSLRTVVTPHVQQAPSFISEEEMLKTATSGEVQTRVSVFSVVSTTPSSTPIIYNYQQPPVETLTYPTSSNFLNIEKPSKEKIISLIKVFEGSQKGYGEVLENSFSLVDCKTASCLQEFTSSFKSTSGASTYASNSLTAHRKILETFFSDPSNSESLKREFSAYDAILPAAYKMKDSDPVQYEISASVASLSLYFLKQQMPDSLYVKVTEGLHPQQFMAEAIKVNGESKNSSKLKDVLDNLFLYIK